MGLPDKPVVFESRKPCAADRSGFLAKPAGRPKWLARTEQNLRKQKLRQYQFFNSPGLALGC